MERLILPPLSPKLEGTCPICTIKAAAAMCTAPTIRQWACLRHGQSWHQMMPAVEWESWKQLALVRQDEPQPQMQLLLLFSLRDNGGRCSDACRHNKTNFIVLGGEMFTDQFICCQCRLDLSWWKDQRKLFAFLDSAKCNGLKTVKALLFGYKTNFKN